MNIPPRPRRLDSPRPQMRAHSADGRTVPFDRATVRHAAPPLPPPTLPSTPTLRPVSPMPIRPNSAPPPLAPMPPRNLGPQPPRPDNPTYRELSSRSQWEQVIPVSIPRPGLRNSMS